MRCALQAVVTWLRQGGAAGAPVRFGILCRHLRQEGGEGKTIATLLCRWLSSVRVYPTLITIGIFSRSGFSHEFRHRLYERLNPAYKDCHDLRDVLALLFCGSNDGEWLATIPLSACAKCAAATCATKACMPWKCFPYGWPQKTSITT